jgi:hypothetical protein
MHLNSLMTFSKGQFVNTLYKVLLFWNCIFFLFILLNLLMRLDILNQFATESHMFYFCYTVCSESCCALIKGVGSDAHERRYRSEPVLYCSLSAQRLSERTVQCTVLFHDNITYWIGKHANLIRSTSTNICLKNVMWSVHCSYNYSFIVLCIGPFLSCWMIFSTCPHYTIHMSVTFICCISLGICVKILVPSNHFTC